MQLCSKQVSVRKAGAALPACVVFIAMVFPWSVGAQIVSFNETTLPTAGSTPQGIVVGQDGAMWFTESSSDKIGRITDSGIVTEFALPSGSHPQQIVLDFQDGSLWFTATGGNYIGRILTNGNIAEFSIPTANAGPYGITAGLSTQSFSAWFTEMAANKIGFITADGSITEYTIPTPNSSPANIAVGGDGNIWFTETAANKIGTIGSSGVITEYTVTTPNSQPFGIAGQYTGGVPVWFTEQATGKIGAMLSNGSMTEYSLPSASSQPGYIVLGPDQNMWFVEQAANKIGRITSTGGNIGEFPPPAPVGAISEFPLPAGSSMPYALAPSGFSISGYLWVTEGASNQVSRATVLEWNATDPNVVEVAVDAGGGIWELPSSRTVTVQDLLFGNHQVTDVVQIAPGSGAVEWMINGQQQIFTFQLYGGHSLLSDISGALTEISVGADNDVWGVNAQSQVWHNDSTTQWSWAGQPLIDIEAGADGSVYGLGPVSGSTQLLYWYNPGLGQLRAIASNSASGPVTGLTKLSVGVDGDLWGFGNQTAYHYDRLLNQWVATGGVFTQVSVGNGTSVWAITPDGFIFQWDAQTQAWNWIPGALTQIAVGANGKVAGVNSSDQAYSLFGPTHAYKALYQVPGSLSQISVGVDGTAWGVDSANRIYHFDLGTQTWQNVPGELTQVAVGSSANVWGVNAVGEIWRWNPSGGGWEYIPGELNQIAVGGDGSVWGINSGSQTFTYDFSTSSWTWIPGELVQLSVGADGAVWGVNAQHQVYYYSAKTQSWMYVSGSLAQIAVGNANNIWGVDSAGVLYQWNSTTQTLGAWPNNIFSSPTAQVAVSFDGTVWIASTDGTLYELGNKTELNTGYEKIDWGLGNQIAIGNDETIFVLNTNTGVIYRYW
ncbi:MAG TPA: tectonin domain-containing protein [Bryobacteraceae bacterium]|nr:tectonin domain-containing protein [Bryobacteraceae bacterium]